MLSEGWDRTLSRRSTRKPHRESHTGGDMQIRAKNVFLLLGVLYGGRVQAVGQRWSRRGFGTLILAAIGVMEDGYHPTMILAFLPSRSSYWNNRHYLL